MYNRTAERHKKRQIAYLYLMHRMFGGNPEKMIETLITKELTVKELQEWEGKLLGRVQEIIQSENAVGGGDSDSGAVPSIKSIKEKVLRRTNSLIGTSDDPARLAQVYKILSEFETTDDKKGTTVIDAVKTKLKAIPESQKETPITMLDVLRAEGKAPMPDPNKRKRGRPKKSEAKTDNTKEE